MGREFFVPAQTLIGVKLLIKNLNSGVRVKGVVK
jgi:hypothetical protein